jgi:oxaloacetate decarboxylase gamma subunit
MDSPNLLNEGLTLMLFGVGFVFAFLTVLVIATSLMSFLIIRHEKKVGVLPEEGIPAPTAVLSPIKPSPSSLSEQDNTLITLFSAAIHKYRATKK